MEVVVVGCGVSGLTCGIVLQEAGYSVQIMTRDMPEKTVSAVAAAIWYPFQAFPITKVLSWGQRSFQVFQHLAQQPSSGVSMVALWELFPEPAPDPWWREAVPHFSRLTTLPPGYMDGFELEVPLIETPIYLNYLLQRFRAGSGTIEQRAVANLDEVAERGRVVINCTGLAARDLVGDKELYPIRGQIYRVKTGGFIPTLIDEHNPTGLTYVIPRQDGVIVGGTAQENDWRLDVDEGDAQAIWQRATHLAPQLAEAEILAQCVGLRPGRAAIRLEQEWLSSDCCVIHNYGHGGAGFTLSWGCAHEVLSLVQTSTSRQP